MDNEKKIEALEQELNQMKDKFNAISVDRDKYVRECGELKYSLNEAKSINERYLRIIERLSDRD